MKICIIVESIVHTLLMSDFISMLVTNILYSIIRVVYDVQLASGVTTSELIWYLTCLKSV